MADSTCGSGEFVYELVPDWAKLPDGWEFTQVAAVAVEKTIMSTPSTALSIR